MTRDQSLEKANIFRIQARRLFGLLLSLLCEEAQISQNKLGKRATAYRRYLVLKGYVDNDGDTGAIEQSGISRIIKAERAPSYSQVYIWLFLLRDIFESNDYRDMCLNSGKDIYIFTEELEEDMWRLACFGMPKEVIAAYDKHKSLLGED
jgi:hypothetical protein